jgi:hypothetical protein
LEFELFRRCFPLHPICHHLQSEYVKVEGMDMPDVEGINMLEEHDHPSNHRSGEEGMNMVGIHMMELEVMDMSEERPTKERSEDEGMDMVEEHSSNHRPEVEGMDIVEDITVEVVER